MNHNIKLSLFPHQKLDSIHYVSQNQEISKFSSHWFLDAADILQDIPGYYLSLHPLQNDSHIIQLQQFFNLFFHTTPELSRAVSRVLGVVAFVVVAVVVDYVLPHHFDGKGQPLEEVVHS